MLKQFKLLVGCICTLLLFAIKHLNICKLLICYTHNDDMPTFRKHGFYAFYMHSCIIHTGTMAYID